MEIKEQTRKLAAGCSKHCFEVVDRTDEVSNHIYGNVTLTWFEEILNKLLSYSEDLKHHYQLYQLLLFHFQNKEPEKFFGLIEDNLKQVHPIFQTVFKTFLKDKEKIVNALQLPYSNAKLEATNNLIKLIKRNAFGFRNFENFKKRIFIALNIKKERTKFVLSRA
ncbi:transposase-like protein%2C IS1167 [Streptococcus pneumoniae]|nr:transposase-like protein%2C IS1167 [Streptococcus pneumoniae]